MDFESPQMPVNYQVLLKSTTFIYQELDVPNFSQAISFDPADDHVVKLAYVEGLYLDLGGHFPAGIDSVAWKESSLEDYLLRS